MALLTKYERGTADLLHKNDDWSRGLKSCVGTAIKISGCWPPEGMPVEPAHRQQQARRDFMRPLQCKWDLQCIMVRKYRRFGTTNRSHLQRQTLFLYCFTIGNGERLVVPKCLYVNNILRCVKSQNSADISSKLMATMNRNDSAQVVFMTAKEMVKTG